MSASAFGVAAAVSTLSTRLLTGVLPVSVALLLIWWLREHRLDGQRRVMRQLYRLGEHMAVGWPPADSLRILREVLPETLKVTGVRLYLYDRVARILHSVAEETGDVIRPAQPSGPLETAVATCFRNRSLLMVPDLRKSPLASFSGGSAQPRSALSVPMFAQTDLVGVLLLIHKVKSRQFTVDEQAVAQHLANQTAIGLKLRERQSVREQLLQNERLAAAGQLISSVAADLKGPIESISRSAGSLADRYASEPIGAELRQISEAAGRTADMVSQLLLLARSDAAEPAPVNLTTVLHGLVCDGARSREQRGVRLDDFLPEEPLMAGGRMSHLRQVFLSLLFHAEGAAERSPEKMISIRASRLADKVNVEIVHSGGEGFANRADPETGALSLDICQSLLRNHGGELRITAGAAGGRRFEVVLAAADRQATDAPPEGPRAKRSRHSLTALVVDPEVSVQKRMIALLGERGHRSVPVASAEEAADLVGRVRFHVIFCSTQLPGQNCLELLERTRDRVPAFVLLAETREAASPDGFAATADYVLAKPVDADEFGRVAGTVESRLVETTG